MVSMLHEPGDEWPAQRSSSSDSLKGSGVALRILLAEDNAVNQHLAQLMLEKLGQRADAVSNGVEAVNAAAQLPYDIILMDMQMPAMDGLEATRRIRELPQVLHQPRIVAMTANVLKGDRERCLAAGMDDYVSKPVKLEELARVLEACPPRGIDAPAVVDFPYDQAVVARLIVAVGSEAMGSVLDTMINDAPRLLGGLQQALADSSARDIRLYAHTLKSNAMTVGAAALARQLQELESMSVSGSMAGATLKAQQVQEAYRQLMSVIKASLGCNE